MSAAFSRMEMLLGPEALGVLAGSRVIVFGVGGVGGHAVEALGRCGVGGIDLVDDDLVDETNINRQIVATTLSVGRPKVEVMAERVLSINPGCRVTPHRCFYLPESASSFDLSRYDYVLDAVDTVTAKLSLALSAQGAGVPLISSMGAANRLDPTAFEVADIYETSVCPLARIMRKECRKRGIRGFKAVYSKEPARTPMEVAVTGGQGPHHARRPLPGSVSFVPPVAGLIMAGEVVKDLVGPGCGRRVR